MTTLRQALWKAQAGCCWICRESMRPLDARPAHHPKRSSLDHVWPRSIYGENGDFGLTLLAHQDCNSERGNRIPTDADIRLLVSTYRRLDRSVLTRFLAEAKLERARAEAAKARIALAMTFLEAS
jgi:hypothetical protein